MVLVRCWKCGVSFELTEAMWCGGHMERTKPDPRSPLIIGECKCCPNGDPLHGKPGFDLLPRREPTTMEAIMGFDWILASVPEE